MVDFNFQEYLGGASKIAGLGTVIYGLVRHDMEIIAAGAAMAYVGKTMHDSVLEDSKNSIQRYRNAILKERNSIKDKTRAIQERRNQILNSKETLDDRV